MTPKTRKLAFWLGVIGFLAFMAWTILSGRGAEPTGKPLYLATNTYPLLITQGDDFSDGVWLKIRDVKPKTQGTVWSRISPTNMEITCTHEPVVVGPTNGEWTIRFK